MIKFIFYRTLNSQSAASVTVANLCAILRREGYSATMTLLDKSETDLGAVISQDCDRFSILIYKVNSMDYKTTFPVLEKLAQAHTFRKIILCGPFASLNAEELLTRFNWIDGVLLGTGECAVLELARIMSEPGDEDSIINIDGGAWRVPFSKEIVLRKNTKHFSLDELPLPAREVERKYSEKIANLEFSRGCENLCRYCHMRVYYEEYGLRRESKTVDQVMEDLQHLFSLGKRYFIFNDSVFWNDEGDTQRIIELCDRIESSNLQISFMIYLSMYHFPPFSLLKRMRQVGLIRVFIGVESIDCKILQAIKENTYPSLKFLEIKRKLDALYISSHIGYIVFYPFSTIQQVADSIEYLHKLGKTYRIGIILERLRIIPGTPMQRYAEAISDDSVDRAYSYHIADEKAEALHSQLTKVFEDYFQGSYIQNELLCSASDLALSIMMRDRTSVPESVKTPLERHKKNIAQYAELIYNYLMYAIHCVKSNQLVGIPPQFEFDFYDSVEELKSSWSDLLFSMQAYTEFDLEKIIPRGR